MPESMAEVNWNGGRQAGLVSIGTHKLFLSSSGPDRDPESKAPAVIFEVGFDDSHISLIAVPRFLTNHTRVYLYDRSGFGKSQPSPSPRTAVVMAEELHSLLKVAKIQPPYIYVAHSFGGVVAREFLELVGTGETGVVGMVLVDTNHEDTIRDEKFLTIPQFAYEALMKNIDYLAITGVDTNNKLTPEEWLQILNYPHSDPVEEAFKNSERMLTTLKEKKQLDRHALGNYPLSVIKGSRYRDFKMVLEWVKRNGNGSSKEEQEAFEKGLGSFAELDERLTRDQLRLSAESAKKRYVYAEKSGHLVPMEEPELIGREVLWVLESAMGK